MNIETRPYLMKVRAEKAAATRERIVKSATDLIVERTLDGLTLDAIADARQSHRAHGSGIFGSKDEVFAAAVRFEGDRGHGRAPPRRRRRIDQNPFDDYEKIGDAVILRLADEGRVPALDALLKSGRVNHRRWIEQSFAPQLASRDKARRAALLTAILVATDVYAWKLLRRDFALGRRAAEAVIRGIVDSLVGGG